MVVGYDIGVSQSKKPLTTLLLDEELLKKIEDFRYKNRFPSRAAAMKWLMNAALDKKLRPPASDDS